MEIRIAYIARNNVTPSAQFVRGMHEYNREQGGPLAISALIHPTESDLALLDADCAVVFSLPEQANTALQRLRIPVICLFDSEIWPTTVTPDDYRVGELGGEYLLQQHHTRILFYGSSTEKWSLLRLQGLEAVTQGKAQVESCLTNRQFHADSPDLEQSFVEILGSGTGVSAIFAADDGYGISALRGCKSLGLRVPTDLAVLGVNNSVEAEIAAIPLSSVDVNWLKMGSIAAQQAVRSLNGEDIPERTLVQPAAVVPRSSTGSHHECDPVIGAAVRVIRERFSEGINATEVARLVHLSPAALQKRFRRKLNRSVGDQLREVRLQHARRLLRGSALSIQSIAEAVGFQSLPYFSRMFHKMEGITPSDYRKADKG